MTDKTKNIIFIIALAIIAIAYWTMVGFGIKKSFEPIKTQVQEVKELNELKKEIEPMHTLYVDQAKVYGLSGSKMRFKVFVIFP